MSNLGFQSLYHRTASFHGIRARRFFIEKNGSMYTPDWTRAGATTGPSTPAECDVILYTVSFELDYVQIIRMLIGSGISPLRAQRRESDPVVIVGGMPVTVNPRITARIADVIYRGDMEVSIDRMLGCLMDHGFKKGPRLLEGLAELEGCFVPAVSGGPPEVAILERIEEPAHTVIMTKKTEFSGMFLIEVCRGCRNTCTFCLVRCAASPPRCVPVEPILDTVAEISKCSDFTEATRGTAGHEGLGGPTGRSRFPVAVHGKNTVDGQRGFTRVGLIAPVLTDHTHLATIVRGLNGMGKRVSFSSLRADYFTEETARLLRENGQTTVTFAPETGSEKLRRRIGKGLDDAALLNAVSLAQEYGVRRFRYYIMYGLPGESEDDIAAITRLVERTLAVLQPSGSTLHVSINPFIPKKQTPLEGFEIYPIKYYRRHAAFLKARLGSLEQLTVRMEPLRHVQIQYHLSIGDEPVGELLCRAVLEEDMKGFVKSVESMEHKG